MEFSELMAHLAPTIGVITTGWFGLRASKSANLNKEQFKELKGELGTIKKTIDKVKGVGEDNNEKIKEISDRLELHNESHITTMYLRLERDIKTALTRGYTNIHESDVIHRMHKNYKDLGGNGYIDGLFKKYLKLEIKE